MLSSPHTRAASFLQIKLKFSIISQLLLPDNTALDEEKTIGAGDGSNEPLASSIPSNSLAIKLPPFSGEDCFGMDSNSPLP